MKKILLIIGAPLLGISVYFVLFVVVGVQTYLPHKRIVIRVPYDLSDIPEGLIPMGETIHHPKPQVPNGHPGIDFGWNDADLHRVVSSSDGRVSGITQGASNEGKWDIAVNWGQYQLRYKELEDYDRNLKLGSTVKRGDLIGYGGIFEGGDPKAGNKHVNWHWELASIAFLRDRWCPISYLDDESRKSIGELWARQPNDRMKMEFPEICSGDYKGKEESI